MYIAEQFCCCFRKLYNVKINSKGKLITRCHIQNKKLANSSGCFLLVFFFFSPGKPYAKFSQKVRLPIHVYSAKVRSIKNLSQTPKPKEDRGPEKQISRT